MPGQHVALEHAAGAGERDPGRVQWHHQSLELRHHARLHRLGIVALLELEPVEAVRRERDHVGQFADCRKTRAAEHFQRDALFPGRQVELGRLRRTRQVGDAENDLALVLADIGEHRAIGRADEGHRAAAKGER